MQGALKLSTPEVRIAAILNPMKHVSESIRRKLKREPVNRHILRYRPRLRKIVLIRCQFPCEECDRASSLVNL